MARGRKKLPTNVKMIKGTYQACRENQNEPKTKVQKVRVPSGLSSVGKTFFRNVMQRVMDMKVFTQSDAHALEIIAFAWQEFKEADKEVRKEGMTYSVYDQNGNLNIKKHPAVLIRSDAWKRVMQGLVQFGLTPSARSGVEVIKDHFEETYENKKSKAF